jgi:hypothetical protein
MRTSTFALFYIVGSACFSFALESETKQFTSAYNVSISTPKDWVWDSESVRDAKVTITEMLFKIKTDGKVRLLNTGLPPASPDGYCRIRLNILSNAKLSQKETRELSDADLEELAKGAREELTNMPTFTVTSISRRRQD